MAQLTSPISAEAIATLAAELAGQTPQKILEQALKQFDNIAISFSGAEDVVLVDMAVKLKKNVQIFSLDTGRLHPETYQYLETVRKHYGIQIEVMYPDAAATEKLVREKGFYSFYEDDHKECCGIRKVQPLRRKLSTVDAWVTGQRKDQSPCTKKASSVLAVSLVPVRYCPISTSAKAAGGGKKRPRKNAVSTP
jgi:phosphoadenosine phosphosulfate reductase